MNKIIAIVLNFLIPLILAYSLDKMGFPIVKDNVYNFEVIILIICTSIPLAFIIFNLFKDD